MPLDTKCQQMTDHVLKMANEMSMMMRMTVGANENVAASAPRYLRAIRNLAQQCPDVAEPDAAYTARLATWDGLLDKIHDPDGGPYSFDERQRLSNVVISRIWLDRRILRENLGWGGWFAHAMSRRPRCW